jgi:NitT/TauT family transport system permease protein
MVALFLQTAKEMKVKKKFVQTLVTFLLFLWRPIHRSFRLMLRWLTIPLRIIYAGCRVNAKPGKAARIILPWFLFAAALILYSGSAYLRHKENPDDKLIPTPKQMVQGFCRMAYAPDSTLNDSTVIIKYPNSMAGRWTQFKITIKRIFTPQQNSGEWLNVKNKEGCLFIDTLISAERFVISAAIIFVLSLFLGLMMRLPYVELFLGRFFMFTEKIPPIALLPILFIVFGLGEVSKVALIVFSVVPGLVLDLYLRVKTYPSELVIKSMTLGAGSFNIVFRTILPRIFPEFLDSWRLQFKTMVAYLLIGESLSAIAGLGYRIFVVRRYMAMDVIIPYVLWISLFVFVLYLSVQLWIEKKYYWFNK